MPIIVPKIRRACACVVGIALFAALTSCSYDDGIEEISQMTIDEREELAAQGRREIEAQFQQKFQTMTSEELTLSRSVSNPQEMVSVRGVLHSTQDDLFPPDRVTFLLVQFVTADNVIGNEKSLEVTPLGDGRFEYTAELKAPAYPGEYTTQIVYGGQHILTSTPFQVQE